MTNVDPIGALFARAEHGDGAARAHLFAALYDELRRLARSQIHRVGVQGSLGATTLLHEAFLSLSSRDAIAITDRGRFMAYAARAMRGLAIDHVRGRKAQKRGGDVDVTSLDNTLHEGAAAAEGEDLEAIGDALDALAQVDPGLAEVVDLKFFCGFSFGEIAAQRGISERTVQRQWEKARLFLHRALEPSAPH